MTRFPYSGGPQSCTSHRLMDRTVQSASPMHGWLWYFSRSMFRTAMKPLSSHSGPASGSVSGMHTGQHPPGGTTGISPVEHGPKLQSKPHAGPHVRQHEPGGRYGMEP